MSESHQILENSKIKSLPDKHSLLLPTFWTFEPEFSYVFKQTVNLFCYGLFDTIHNIGRLDGLCGQYVCPKTNVELLQFTSWTIPWSIACFSQKYYCKMKRNPCHRYLICLILPRKDASHPTWRQEATWCLTFLWSIWWGFFALLSQCPYSNVLSSVLISYCTMKPILYSKTHTSDYTTEMSLQRDGWEFSLFVEKMSCC